MRKPLALLLLYPCLMSLAHAEGNVYRAVIDPHTHALLTLRAEDGQEHGQVYYETSGADGLELTGKSAPGHRFDWRESLWTRTANASQPTGRFTGNLAADGKSGQGHWHSADGRKNLPLNLARLAQLHTLASQEVNARVDYLAFDEPRYARLNAYLLEQAHQELADKVRSLKDLGKETRDPATRERLAASGDCLVEHAQPTLVSILCKDYVYSGGPHGIPGLYTRTFAVARDGAIKPLALWEVLQKSPAAIKKLSALILADLKRQQASLAVSGAIKDFSKELEQGELAFSVVPVGLAFHFEPYAVATYAEGQFRAVIPNRALEGLYRPDGPLAVRNTSPKPE